MIKLNCKQVNYFSKNTLHFAQRFFENPIVIKNATSMILYIYKNGIKISTTPIEALDKLNKISLQKFKYLLNIVKALNIIIMEIPTSCLYIVHAMLIIYFM